jgi:hypothetical protein
MTAWYAGQEGSCSLGKNYNEMHRQQILKVQFISG